MLRWLNNWLARLTFFYQTGGQRRLETGDTDGFVWHIDNHTGGDISQYTPQSWLVSGEIKREEYHL